MSLVSKVLRRISDLSAKQLVLSIVYVLLLAASVGLGLSMRSNATAAIVRDDDPTNSIDGCYNNGGIGAADANELINDIRDAYKCNQGDLGTIYADSRIGLQPEDYNRLKSEWKQGYVFRDGHVEVDGVTVWEGAWTMGRTTLGGKQRDPFVINGKTYYTSVPNISFANHVQYLPAIVLFDANGNVEFAALNACGNPVGGGRKIISSLTCKSLVDNQDDKNPNKHTFTTDIDFTGNAHVTKVVYTFSDDNTTVTKTGADAHKQPVEHIFKKNGEVTVTVYASAPGGKELKATCKKQIEFKVPELSCVLLTASMPDPKDKTKFRFTVTESHGKNVTPKSADFVLDGSATTTVTAKDANGKFYKEYTFSENDGKTHKVKVTVYFDTFNGVKSATSDKCAAEVTPEKIPPCVKNPELPECKPKECKPGIPEGDVRCEECKPGILKGDEKCNPPVLTNTGPGNIAGLFAGTSILGTIGHAFYAKRRNARKSAEVGLADVQ